MFPLPHNVDSQRTQHNVIDQACNRDSSHWEQCVEPVLGCHEARKAQHTSTFASGQGYCDGQCSLHGEVDGKDGSLQAGELRTR